MKSSISLAAAFAALTSAAVIAERKPTGLNGPFAAISSHSGNTQVHLRPINAINGEFQLDGKPTTSCPYSDKSACPAGNTTVFAYSPSQTQLGLEVAVNGGQFVYVNANGALAYTAGHTAGLPKGAVSQGFQYSPPTEKGRVGILDFEGKTAKGNAKGFVACPSANLGAPFTVFVAYEGIFPECIGIGFTTGPVGTDKPAAYQYDV